MNANNKATYGIMHKGAESFLAMRVRDRKAVIFGKEDEWGVDELGQARKAQEWMNKVIPEFDNFAEMVELW